MGELKPCPLCGADAECIRTGDVGCVNADCIGHWPVKQRFWQSLPRKPDANQCNVERDRLRAELSEARGLLSEITDDHQCYHCADDPDSCSYCRARMLPSQPAPDAKPAGPSDWDPDCDEWGRGIKPAADDKPSDPVDSTCHICGKVTPAMWRCDTCAALVCSSTACHVNGDCRFCYESGAHIANLSSEDREAIGLEPAEPVDALGRARACMGDDDEGVEGPQVWIYHALDAILDHLESERDKRRANSYNGKTQQQRIIALEQRKQCACEPGKMDPHCDGCASECTERLQPILWEPCDAEAGDGLHWACYKRPPEPSKAPPSDAKYGGEA